MSQCKIKHKSLNHQFLPKTPIQSRLVTGLLISIIRFSRSQAPSTLPQSPQVDLAKCIEWTEYGRGKAHTVPVARPKSINTRDMLRAVTLNSVSQYCSMFCATVTTLPNLFLHNHKKLA